MYFLGYRKALAKLVARRTVVVNDESRPGIPRFYTEDPWSHRIELVDAETPDVRQSSPVKAHQEAASADPRPAVEVSPQPGWRNLRILAIPGSLRTASSNAILLDSAAALTPGTLRSSSIVASPRCPTSIPTSTMISYLCLCPSFVPSYAYPMESCSRPQNTCMVSRRSEECP